MYGTLATTVPFTIFLHFAIEIKNSLLFSNTVTFLAFLAEVIKQTILAKDKREYCRMSNNHRNSW